MKNGQLQLLICSANLGNEQPDEESLKLLLPLNGKCNDIMKYPANYPVRDQFCTFDDYCDEDCFDLIVFGMQEATFDPAHSDFESDDNDVKRLGNGSSHAKKKPKKGITRAIGNLSSYTASKNHIKNTAGVKNTVSDGTKGGDEALVAMAMGEGNKDVGTAILHEMMQNRLPSYTHLVSFQRGQMRLEIFAKQQENVLIAEVEYTKAQNTGRAGLANKGGIVAEISINKRTRLSFLTAHLEAHEGSAKYQARCSSLADILGGAKPNTSLHDASLTSHYCFVMGDLNFRTELPEFAGPNADEEEHKRQIRKIVDAKNWEKLNEFDELNRALRVKDCLVGFQTLLCNFPPTFKVERTPGYNYITKRRPSYTDRILWKNSHLLENGVRPYVYEPIDDFKSSDHKPIRAAFGLRLNQPAVFRPKMARRRSAMQMAGDFFTTHNPSSTAVAHRERLHIFVSDITVHLNAKLHSLPNPYVCIVTTPEELAKKFTSRLGRWKKAVIPGFLRGNIISSDDHGAPILRTPQGWPQSSVQKQTAQPLWDGEEFHTEIRTHRSDGTSLDLTGSMIRFTVMDCKHKALVSSSSDHVLGSSAYNLGHLVTTFRPPGESRPSPTQVPPAPKPQRRGSIMNLFRRDNDSGTLNVQSPTAPGTSSPADEQDPVKTIPIDAPLYKNGIETGRIRFTMDAWWMTENTAKAILGGGGTKSLQTNFGSPAAAAAAARAAGGKRRNGQERPTSRLSSAEGGSSHMFSQRREIHSLRGSNVSSSLRPSSRR